MIVVDVFLILIFVTLIIFGVLSLLAWQKISVFLTWNTRYTSQEYEQAITQSKISKPSLASTKTEKKGREITPVPDLVDIADLDFETAFKAVAEVGEK